MDPRLLRILAVGSATTLAAGLLLWDSLASGGGVEPAVLVPPLLILLAGLALVLRSRREDPSGTPRRAAPVAARVGGAVIGALVALGAVVWDRFQDKGGVPEPAGDDQAPWLVLGAIVLVALLMVLVKRWKEERNQRPR